MNFLLVFLGGGIGSILRYAIAVILSNNGELFPLPTFVANILASLLLGFFIGVHGLTPLSDSQRLFFMTGVCGGFSTFSTFSAETVGLIQADQWILAFIYIFGSILLGVAGILFGVWIGSLVSK